MGLEFLIISWLVSRYLVRNYWQDGIAAWRGEDPPSYRREQERLKSKQAKGEGPDPNRAAKRYFANAWNDAFETAEEKRGRRRRLRLEKLHDRWAEEDGGRRDKRSDRPEGSGDRAHEWDEDHREDGRRRSEWGGGDRTETDTPEEEDSLCWYCKREPAAVINFDDSGEPRPACTACAEARARRPYRDRGTPDPGPPPDGLCFYCIKAEATTSAFNGLRELHPACAACAAARDGSPYEGSADPDPDPETEPETEPESNTEPDPDPEPDPEPDPVPDPEPVAEDDDTEYRTVDPEPTATVITFPTMHTNTNTNTKETAMSAEVADLRAAINFTAGSAAQVAEVPKSIELALTGLRAGGTTGVAVTELQKAAEYLNAAAACFLASNAELRKHLSVADQYQANQGAGEKSFVTSGG